MTLQAKNFSACQSAKIVEFKKKNSCFL